MTRKTRLILLLILILLTLAAASYTRLTQTQLLPPRGLPHEGIEHFTVGDYPITIETQSYTIAKGDNGPAKLIITHGNQQTTLDSWFDNDLFQNIRPAYISWQQVDDHPQLDLIIWKPTYSGGLLATDYIASRDGQHHPLNPPRQHTR